MIMIYDPKEQKWSTILESDYTAPKETVDGNSPATARGVAVGDIASVFDGGFRHPVSPGETDRLYFVDNSKKLRVYHKKDSMDLA